MPTPAELLAQSIAKGLTANRIDGNKNSYRRDNPNEYTVVVAYLNGGSRPTSVTSDMGMHLVLEEDARRALLVGPTGPTGTTGPTGSTGVTGPTGPPPAGNPYFVTDYSSGKIGPPWTNVFSYTAPGYNDLTQSGPITQSPDGRVSIVNDPVGSGTKVLRCEIRDSDPDWAVALNPPVDKSEVRSSPSYTWNKSQAAYGDVRWFSMRIYPPYNATEKFEWAHTGGNAFFDISDMHPDSNTWPALGFSWYPSASPEWAKVQICGGAILSNNQHLQTYNLWQLTDSSGARVMANHNRWITLVWGARFHYDNTGWFEAWVDGVNVVPRVSRPTMWINDFAMYWKHGVYKQANAVFPESGRSVLYFGRYAIGMTKADVE